jgi:hypothetical protein
MEYKPVSGSAVVGQRYYIVPESRLITNKFLTKAILGKYSRRANDVKPIPAAKKSSMLLISGVATSEGSYYTAPTFNNFWNKDDAPSKDTRKADEKYVYFSFSATPVPIIGATVTEEEARATVGELSPNVLPESLRPAAAEAGAGSASSGSSSPAPLIQTPMTPAVKKTTDELVATLKLGESRLSVSDILKRKNTPQLENLENRLLTRSHALQILPTDYPVPPDQYYGVQTVNVYSPYGAIELLIESRHYTLDQKKRYIREMVSKGADPSKALITAILSDLNIPLVALLLDLGADPNHVSEYKTTDKTQRFLITPILAALPTQMIGYPLLWNNMKQVIQSLVKIRTFVEQEGALVSANRNSLPNGTMVHETTAYITPKVIEIYQKRLAEHIHAKPSAQRLDVHRAYQELLNWVIAYLIEQSEKQGAVLAEPGGPLYEEARARAYQGHLGTREEQLARNAAADRAIAAVDRNTRLVRSNSNLANATPANLNIRLNGTNGGSRKRRSNKHRLTRRH